MEHLFIHLSAISVSGLGDSQVVLVVKNLPANAGDVKDTGSVLGSGRSPGGGSGNPLQYSCLENPMDRGSLACSSPWGRKEWDISLGDGFCWRATLPPLYQFAFAVLTLF